MGSVNEFSVVMESKYAIAMPCSAMKCRTMLCSATTSHTSFISVVNITHALHDQDT